MSIHLLAWHINDKYSPKIWYLLDVTRDLHKFCLDTTQTGSDSTQTSSDSAWTPHGLLNLLLI
jgi:hypothetical protein